MYRCFPLLVVTLGLAVSALASEAGEESFSQCVARLQDQARQRGLDEQLVAVLNDVEQIERTIELDRSQPEFVQTFTDYFSQRVDDYRIRRGRRMLKEHRPFLEDLTKTYGIPPQYLVSFWALESNFGRNIGKMPVLDSLTTLACDQRRSGFFTGELFAALELMGRYDIAVEQMQGSWAGAMGHTQFMPSAYLQFAVDGDGDGQVDLWQNQTDALTSAAHYLEQLGWQRELRWGREVSLPEGFPYQEGGINNRKSIAAWADLGVRRANGGPLPTAEVEAALLVPAGAEGPKFLVYDNFHVIMRWNRSQFYALAVGHLADRINGAGELHQPPPKTQALTRQQVETLQAELAKRGFDPGEADGQLGPATAAAIRGYQHSVGDVADGYADMALLADLTD